MSHDWKVSELDCDLSHLHCFVTSNDLMRDCEATKSIYNLLLVLNEFRQVLQHKEEITSIELSYMIHSLFTNTFKQTKFGEI